MLVTVQGNADEVSHVSLAARRVSLWIKRNSYRWRQQ